MEKDKRILIIIPTYNERNNIKKLINDISSLGIRLSVLVIDDNSPDHTSDIVLDMRKKYNNLFLIKRNGKLGLGSAYRDGFCFALKNEFDIIFQMDADLSHQAIFLPGMIKLIDSYDLVIGSRYTKEGSVSGWDFRRVMLSRFANMLSKYLLKIPVNDSTSGFKCVTRFALNSIDFNSIKSQGYAFQIEMAYRAYTAGLNIAEYPIVFIGRKSEKSKMSFYIICEALFRLLYLFFKRQNQN
jgi:dolichol-phosphate mannosyltransferase